MSILYGLLCKEHKEIIYIGQNSFIYSDDEEVMRDLWSFLNKHRGCKLEFVNEFDWGTDTVKFYKCDN